MSVYIKGFPLPNNCGACPLRLAWCRERIYMVTRPERCPLVPVQPHGRLIDADALDDILADQSEDTYNRTHAQRSWERALSAMRDYLDDAPTIIPADKEGEG